MKFLNHFLLISSNLNLSTFQVSDHTGSKHVKQAVIKLWSCKGYNRS